jgi:hypothetical protein
VGWGEEKIREFDIRRGPRYLFEKHSSFGAEVGERREKGDEGVKDWCGGRWFPVGRHDFLLLDMAGVALDLVGELRLLNVPDQLVQVDLVSAAGFQQLVGFCNALVALLESTSVR